MKSIVLVLLVFVIFLLSSCAPSRVGVGVSVGPRPYYGPRYYGPRPYYYNPYYYRPHRRYYRHY